MAEVTALSNAEKLDKLLGLAQGLDSRLTAVEARPSLEASGVSAPNYVRGGVRDSAGYSVLKAIAFCKGLINESQAKEEIHVSKALRDLYVTQHGFQTTWGERSFLVPFSSRHMPEGPTGYKLAVEIRQKMYAGSDRVDPDEAAYIRKAMGTTSDLAGGTLVGFPTLGELIDLQRNMEVFARAGATESPLPGNALMDYPKLSGGSTAYWVGEGSPITASDQTTGDLKLVGKKLAVVTKINNELIRYANPTAEAMVRGDMAAQAALKADLAQLEGTGGTQPKGLITYSPTSTSWTQGEDKLLTYAVTSNLFQPEDVYKMQGVMPDIVQGYEKKFIMRNDLWGAVAGRRADAITAADGKGPFVFNITREMGKGILPSLNGYDVVTSSQVSNTRSTSKTYVILGAFRDWIIARFGAVEFKMTDTGDTPFSNDQTWIRAIQIMDAGPRHAASFVFADNVNIA